MNDGLTGLRAALEERDRLRSFAARLQTLKAEGSLSPAEYATGSADYERRIAAATSRIGAMKAAVAKDMVAAERERDLCRLKRESAEARHRAGETTLEQVEAEKRKWTTHEKRIEQRREGLAATLAAETSADLGDAEVVPASGQPNMPTSPEATAGPAATSFPAVSAARITLSGWTRLRIASLVAAFILVVRHTRQSCQLHTRFRHR